MPRGSPPSITADHVKRAHEARRLGMTLSLTADYIGINERALYVWKEKGEAGSTAAKGLYVLFAQALKRGAAEGAALSLGRIQKKAREGVWTADAWLLERVHGYRANAPPEERHTPPVSSSGQPEELSDAELARRLRAHLEASSVPDLSDEEE
jgi:hypothetical protein